MKRLLIVLFFSVAAAQGAMESICVMSQGVAAQELAEELRKAAVERGVSVYLLVPPALVQQPASYVPGLSLLDNVHVRLLHHDETFMIQDAATVFDVGETLRPLTTNTAMLYDYFLTEWAKGTPYVFRVIPREE